MEWINTMEKMPKPKETVIIKYYAKGKEKKAVAIYDGVYVFNFKGSLKFQRASNVTAWKPYNEEERIDLNGRKSNY